MHTTHHRIIWLWAAPGYVLPFQLVYATYCYGWTTQLRAPACTGVSSFRSHSRRSVPSVKSAAFAATAPAPCAAGSLARQLRVDNLVEHNRLHWRLRAHSARTRRALAVRESLAPSCILSSARWRALPRSECHFVPCAAGSLARQLRVDNSVEHTVCTGLSSLRSARTRRALAVAAPSRSMHSRW